MNAIEKFPVVADPLHHQLADLLQGATAVFLGALVLLMIAEGIVKTQSSWRYGDVVQRTFTIANIANALAYLGGIVALPGLWLWELLTGTTQKQVGRALEIEAGLIASRQINAKRAQAQAEAKFQMVRSMLAQMEADIEKDLAKPDPTSAMREGWINTGSGWVQMDPTDCPEPRLRAA